MAASMDYRVLRERMVERHIRARGIQDRLVLGAMHRVERHRFVPKRLEKRAYEDHPLPIGQEQTISQPYIVALMTELARVGGTSRVLDVGTGSGYQTAILAEICEAVFSIEIVESLGLRAKQLLTELGYDNVQTRIGDGYSGWREEAPFDAILVAAAPRSIPKPLLEQLAVGGRLVIPVGQHVAQDLMVVERTTRGFEKESVLPVRFVPMTGEIEQQQ